jgi:hypothetical protein
MNHVIVACQMHCAKYSADSRGHCVNHVAVGDHGTFNPPLFSPPTGDETMAATDVTVVPFDAVDSVSNSAALGMAASNGGDIGDPELIVTFQEYR